MNRPLLLPLLLLLPSLPASPLACASGLCRSSARAEDWPEFRGPTGQGLVTGSGELPLHWGPMKNVAWKQAIPGVGWSSPVVVSGRVYLTSAVPDQKKPLSLRALCLDGATGKILWNEEVFTEGPDAPRIHGKNSHASPTPLVQDGKLFVHFGHMGTACLDTSGKVIWKQRIDYPPVHGNGGSPVLVDDQLVFSCDGAEQCWLVALDRDKGTIRWKIERTGKPFKKFSFSTPLVIEVAGKKQIISPASDLVGAYEPATGKEIWKVRYTGYSVIPRPVFGLGLLFLSTGFDRPQFLAIRPDGKGDVTETHVAWTLTRNAPNTPSPLLVGEELYLVSDGGMVSCLEARTGKVHWQKRLATTFSASPIHAAGRIYLQGEDGLGVVLKAGKVFEELARNPMGEKTLASYAVADRSLFLRTEKYLYRISQ
jgi:outer membrane protein assembly factor BamB